MQLLSSLLSIFTVLLSWSCQILGRPEIEYSSGGDEHGILHPDPRLKVFPFGFCCYFLNSDTCPSVVQCFDFFFLTERLEYSLKFRLQRFAITQILILIRHTGWWRGLVDSRPLRSYRKSSRLDDWRQGWKSGDNVADCRTWTGSLIAPIPCICFWPPFDASRIIYFYLYSFSVKKKVP